MRGVVLVCVLASCTANKASKTPTTPTPPPATPQTTTTTTTPQAPVEAPPVEPAPPEPTREPDLYPLDEALADVLSGPLEHIGTGAWFGMFKVTSCAYRNARVVVVNIYCSPTEVKAFSVVVLSPTRGRVVIYAEGNKPISRLKRRDYFTFKAESAPSATPPVSLAFRFDELTAWDEKRYRKWIPACFGGVELKKPQGGCLTGLETQVSSWKARNQPFLDDPPEDWYRVIREMRTRAVRDGKNAPHAGG
jgi:hypothetical protein